MPKWVGWPLDRLRTSAVCLVGADNDLSPHMERLLRQAQRDVPPQKRILEVNPEHEQIRALDKRLKDKRDDNLLKQYAEREHLIKSLARR